MADAARQGLDKEWTDDLGSRCQWRRGNNPLTAGALCWRSGNRNCFARHHETLRAQGVRPIDYNDTDLAGSVLKLAPNGVDAVFDHLGGARSFGLLAKGGVLVCYAIASALNDTRNVLIAFLKVLIQLGWWNIMPNGRKAYFYNIWDGKGSEIFREQLRETFKQLTTLLGSGALRHKSPPRIPLAQITAAMKLAESRTAYGKVVIVP